MTFHEIARQEYGGNHCAVSAGAVMGSNKPRCDTVYLRLDKEGVHPTILLLRPDEMAAVAWVTTGTLWSYLMGLLDQDLGLELEDP